MAGHWIKWEKGLERKPEVMRIARSMGVPVLHAAAMCMAVWAWADDNSTDGVVGGVTTEDLSAAVGIEGISESMRSVGWLVESESGIQFPNYIRHNGITGKERALDAMRKRVRRATGQMSGTQPDIDRTRTGRVHR